MPHYGIDAVLCEDLAILFRRKETRCDGVNPNIMRRPLMREILRYVDNHPLSRDCR